MATDYSQLSFPFDENLRRGGELDVPTSTPETGGGGVVADVPVKNDGAMDDVWIKNFIKSTNWKSKTRGFYIDGRTGYAEFTSLSITGTVSGLNIVGATFSTALPGVGGPRIDITSSNNINLYDNTTTGGLGNTSDIRFIHDLDITESHVIGLKYRCGFSTQENNVLQLVADAPAAGGKNYFYIGRDGWTLGSRHINYIEISSHSDFSLPYGIANGTAMLSVDQDTADSIPNVWVTSARNVWYDGTKRGVVISSTSIGTDGFITTGFMTTVGNKYAVTTTILNDDYHFYVGNGGVPQGESPTKPVALSLGFFTTAERNAFPNPYNGDLIYNTDTNTIDAYIAGSWHTLNYT